MRILMIALLAATGMLSIQAQERTISAAEFAAAESAADAQFVAKQTPARWTIATESRLEGRPQTDYVSRSVTEFGPDNSVRRSSTSSFGGDPRGTEIVIKVGNRSYTRTGDGDWKETAVEASYGPAKATDSETEVTESHVEYKYLGGGIFDGKKVRMYLRTERKKQIAKTAGVVSGTEISTMYWFGESGNFYRSEYRSTTTTGSKIFHTNITIQKELDPTISVSAPVM